MVHTTQTVGILILLVDHIFAGVVKRNVICSELPQIILSEILGGAFNSRYMSITPPEEALDPENPLKRTASGAYSQFYVDDDFSVVLSNRPAWTYNHVDDFGNAPSKAVLRPKRNPRTKRQWDCESQVVWVDLGEDYFPRYLRTVECKAKLCWYGHYKCKPRSFTVKVLKRKRDRCVFADVGAKVGVDGLPSDLRELWVWEERAVNFCCDCSQ